MNIAATPTVEAFTSRVVGGVWGVIHFRLDIPSIPSMPRVARGPPEDTADQPQPLPADGGPVTVAGRDLWCVCVYAGGCQSTGMGWMMFWSKHVHRKLNYQVGIST